MAMDKELYTNDTVRGRIQQAALRSKQHDPMWDLPADKLKTFMNYGGMIKDSADQLNLRANNPWINQLESARSDFYSKQVKTGNAVVSPDTPKYPLNARQSSLMTQAAAITNPQAKANFYNAHPELTTIDNMYGNYVNEVRKTEGAVPLPTPPQPSKQVEGIIKTYNALPQHDGPKGGNKSRSIWIQNNPGLYKQMIGYYTQASLYSLVKSAAADELSGKAGSDQKFLKAAYDLGQYDIVKNSDGSYSLGSSTGSSGSSSGGSGSSGYSKSSSGYSKGSGSSGGSYVSYSRAVMQNPDAFSVNAKYINTPDLESAGKPKVTSTTKGGYKPKTPGFKAKGSPKVSFKMKAVKA
jgi:uncharacterized membrane protein YgcG